MSLTLLFLLAACGTSDVGTCDTLDDDAVALKQSFQACDSTTTCVVVDLYDLVGDDNCVGAFQCSDAFPDDADLDAFAAQAAPFVEKQATCGACAEADCLGPDSVTAACNETTGLCEIQM